MKGMEAEMKKKRKEKWKEKKKEEMKTWDEGHGNEGTRWRESGRERRKGGRKNLINRREKNE